MSRNSNCRICSKESIFSGGECCNSRGSFIEIGGDECSSVLFAILRNTMEQEDLFLKDSPNIKVLSSEFEDYHFLSYLDYSSWTSSFAHGADMLPGMYEGFFQFLKEQGSTLSKINRIRFKDRTQGDIVYHVRNTKSSSLTKEASVIGDFLDNKGITYYFYGIPQDRGLRSVSTFKNYLSGKCLFGEKQQPSSGFYEQTAEDQISLTLFDCELGSKNDYLRRLVDNPGYIRTIVLDMINKLYYYKLGGGGVVIGYKNLHIDGGFDPLILLSGGYTLTSSPTSERLKIGDKGYGYKYSFGIEDSDKNILLSGSATLLQTSQKGF